MKIVAALGVALAAITTGAFAAPRFPNVVQVEGGEISGARSAGVLSFKGVPFAAPPVGVLRWRAPQPVRPWKGRRSATAYGHDCMQNPFPGDAAPLRTEPSEDCLVLNVWRPSGQTARKLPVMVWIYGGGFVNGGSSPAVYDGSRFARRGLVFVSFNYRLGRFGFFGHPALTRAAPRGEPLGNYGYMDQIAALKWVRRNIARFGGDPDQVTVFGESAGGGSVHMLLSSPAARGLFQRAIIESGGGRGPLLPMVPVHAADPVARSAESVGVAFARANGIEGQGSQALAALRRLPAVRVVDGLNMATMAAARATYVGGPVLDAQIVREAPDTAYRAGRNAKVPVMIGANDFDLGFSDASTLDAALAGFPDKAQARAAYDPQGKGDIRAIAHDVAMDRMMVEPARLTAKLFALQGLPAYEYRFAYVASSLRKSLPGALHASEIPFVFDTVAAKYGTSLTADDKAVARAANAYWANFAKSGNPNGPGLPPWPAYEPRTDVLMLFGPSGPAATPDPWKARLDLVEAAAGLSR